MIWLNNKEELQKQVEKCIQELGFEVPSNEKELKAWDEKFKDYPYQLKSKDIDPHKILDTIKLNL